MNYAEKQRLLEQAHKYAQADNELTVGRYQRLVSWLSGMSYKEIGEGEGVSAQAIAQSVKRDIELVKAFAKTNHK